MKRTITLLLALCMLSVGCSMVPPDTSPVETTPADDLQSLATLTVAGHNSTAGTNQRALEKWQTIVPEEPLDLVISVKSENVVIKQGVEFKIEVDPGSETSYTIRDNRNIPYEKRYFYYANWSLIFERKKDQDVNAVHSSTITVTIPENIETQYFYLSTGSGNIHVEGLNNVDLIIDGSGDIYIADTDTRCIQIHSGNKIELMNVTATKDIEIRYKSYYGGEYMTGPNGEHTIVLEARK